MTAPKDLSRRNARTAIVVLAVVGMMVGFAYASAPLFRVVCEALGIGGTTHAASAGPKFISEVPVTIRFDSNVDPALPWEFKPAEKSVTIKFGETATVIYHAKNLSDRPIAGIASFNVTPEKIGTYFSCSCFKRMVLRPGEEADLAATFAVDPDLLNDQYANEVRTITLSYTFFPSANGVPAEKQESRIETPAAPGGIKVSAN